MKYIINLKKKEQLKLNDIENKIRSARNSNDYVLVNYGTKGDFIKISFQKDATYTIGYNIWNMEFWNKTRILLRQYKVSNVYVLALYLTNWINKLNV